MRLFFCAIGLSLGVLATTGPASADAIQDRYCLQGWQWGYPGDCQFSTLDQCLASASGTAAGCGINPLGASGPQQPASRRAAPVPRYRKPAGY